MPMTQTRRHKQRKRAASTTFEELVAAWHARIARSRPEDHPIYNANTRGCQ